MAVGDVFSKIPVIGPGVSVGAEAARRHAQPAPVRAESARTLQLAHAGQRQSAPARETFAVLEPLDNTPDTARDLPRGSLIDIVV